MLIGRVGGSYLTDRLPGERLLKASSGFSLAYFALARNSTLWPFVFLGLLLTGVGMSVQWPLGLALAVRASGGLTDRATAATYMAGSLAIAVASFTLGTLSDSIGFHAAFLLVPALLTAALGIIVTRTVRHAAPGAIPRT